MARQKKRHDSGKCPMLDLQVWIDKKEGHCRVRHTFYQKLSTSPLVFNSKGAHTWQSKIVTLAEELKRRFLNMDSYHTTDERLVVVTDFLHKMLDSGYDHRTRMEVVKSAAKKYYRQVMN